MGCDIHLYVEKKTDNGWVRAEPMVPNPYFGKWEDEPESHRDEFYRGRNYALFAMLAGVRNGSGFAGCDIGDPVVPISEERGLPEDVSGEVKERSDYWDSDGHTHSYFSLRELLAAPWHTNTITHRGWIGSKEFERWDRFNSAPQESCGAVSGRDVKHVSHDEMRAHIAAGTATPGHYTQVTWTQKWSEAAHFADAIVRMGSVAATESLDLDSVRAVFWFDN